MKVLSTRASLQVIINAMKKHKKVFFTRFGDNDIFMMSGKDNAGRPLGGRALGGNRTVWTEELQKEMISSFVIKDPRYLKAVSVTWEHEPGMREGVHAPFKYKGRLEGILNAFTNEQEFLIPILFHYIILFNPFIFNNFIDKYVRDKKKLFIGSVPQVDVEKIIGKVDYYVNTPSVSAYQTINTWYKEVEEIIKNEKVEVVIPTCGQCSRIIQGRMWEIDKEFWSIDMGSLFDAFGKPTRTWLKLEGRRIVERYG